MLRWCGLREKRWRKLCADGISAKCKRYDDKLTQLTLNGDIVPIIRKKCVTARCLVDNRKIMNSTQCQSHHERKIITTIKWSNWKRLLTQRPWNGQEFSASFSEKSTETMPSTFWTHQKPYYEQMIMSLSHLYGKKFRWPRSRNTKSEWNHGIA